MTHQPTPSQLKATKAAVRKIAYYTATMGKGKNKAAALAHCKRLGIDPSKPLDVQSNP
jgi:hypothetical protein